MNKADSDSRESGVLSNPLSFLHNGFFNWNSAGLTARGSYGYYWSLRSYSNASSSDLGFGNTDLGPQYSDSRGYGMAVRCV